MKSVVYKLLSDLRAVERFALIHYAGLTCEGQAAMKAEVSFLVLRGNHNDHTSIIPIESPIPKSISLD